MLLVLLQSFGVESYLPATSTTNVCSIRYCEHGLVILKTSCVLFGWSKQQAASRATTYAYTFILKPCIFLPTRPINPHVPL